jgi:hypothetical protein
MRLDGRDAPYELREVAMAHPNSVGEGLLENAGEDRLQHLQTHLLVHLAAKSIHRGLPLLQATAGSDPCVAPAGAGDVTNQEDATSAIVEEAAGGPERVFGRPEPRVVRRDDELSLHDWNAAEPLEGICESIFADPGAHRWSQGWKAYLTPPRVAGPRTEGSRVPLEDVSDRANKVYDTMKSAGITSEDKMRDAEAITKMSKLGKNFVLQALQELQSKGYAKRRAREKAAGYWLIK